jgi:hypothetical protein
MISQMPLDGHSAKRSSGGRSLRRSKAPRR